MYAIGRGALTPASYAASSTANSSASESVCLWITPTAARRTSSALAARVDRPRLLRRAAREQHRLRDLGAELCLERLTHLCDHCCPWRPLSSPTASPSAATRFARSWRSTSIRTSRRSRARTTPPTRSSRELRQEAKDAGLWAPHLPPEAGGSGSGFIEYAYLNEEIGRSTYAQLVFGCQAPDAGNGEILHLFGTDEQKQRFLEPLVAGATRSFFGMTEPEVSGSDPTGLQGRAVLDGDEWVINAHKWFSSGADGAGFGIVMVVTDPDAEPHRRASMIIVPTDTPGYELVRRIPVMGHEGRGWGDALRDAVHRRARAGGEPARRARATAFASRRSGSARDASTT